MTNYLIKNYGHFLIHYKNKKNKILKLTYLNFYDYLPSAKCSLVNPFMPI